MTPPSPHEPTTMELIQMAVQNGGQIEVIERLAKLKMDLDVRRDQELFNQALGRCQSQIPLIVNDAEGQKAKRYATYKALDKVARPVYLQNGLSLSFGSGVCSVPNHVIVTCDVSLGSYSKRYEVPMDASGLGPKGDGALSKPHAILAACEYGRRILLKMIFNIVTGEEEVVTNGEVMVALEDIENSKTIDILHQNYKAAYAKFAEDQPKAVAILLQARNKRQRELKNAAS